MPDIEKMARALHAVYVNRVGPEGETWESAPQLTRDIAIEMAQAAAATINDGRGAIH